MNEQLLVFLMLLGFGAASLVAFLIEWLLLRRYRFPLTCFLAGLGFSLMSIVIVTHWVTTTPDPFTWETIVGDDPWPLALVRALILAFANMAGPILIFHAFVLRKLERKDRDATNRFTAPHSVRKSWN